MFKILVNFAMRSQNVLTNCKRNASIIKRNLPYHRFVKFDEYRDLLMAHLGLKSKAAGNLLYCQQSIFNIPQDHLVKQLQLCQRLNVDTSTLSNNVELLHWPSHRLRQRVLLLQEMGVSHINAAAVSKFNATLLLKMGWFKAYMGIPSTVNVADNLLKCLHAPPPSVPPLETLSETLTVNDYHKECLRWYIQWKLNVSKEDVQTIDRLLLGMKHRSFTLMRRLFDILHHDIGLTIEQIKKYGCLSAGTAEDLCEIIDKIKTFGGVGFKKLIKRHPTLHAMQYENVVAVMKLLEEHRFTDEAMRKCPKVLIVDSNEVASRLEILETTPELQVLKNNVKALVMICKFDSTRIRLEYLRHLNIKYPTVRNLTGQFRYFESFVRTGVDGTRGKEIGYSFEKLLKLGAKEILRGLQKHPYWRRIDLVAMHDTLEFLLERFAPEDLHDSLQLLLYPRDKIAETLERLPELNEISDKKTPCTSKRIIALCLYEMERLHHFSGDGVWKYYSHESSAKPIESELSDFSDSEISETEDGEAVDGCK